MPETSNKIKCPNCEHEFDKDFKYCPHCGQKNIEPDLKLTHFLSEYLSASFNLDSKIFITLRSLLLKPAEITKETLAGKREKYITPIRLYLLISLIYFFVLSLTPGEDRILSINDSGTTTLDTATIAISIDKIDTDTLSAFNKELYKRLKVMGTPQGKKVFMEKLKKNISLGMFIFIPLTALIFFILFRRKTKYYIPNLIFAFHLQSLIFILFTPFAIISFFSDAEILSVTKALLMIFFVFRWVMAFYEIKFWKTVWKMLLFSVAYLFLSAVFFISTFLISIWLIN